MTPRQTGSTRMPALYLQKNEDKQRFAEQIETLELDLQSDATVNFFAAKFGLESQIITVNKPQTGPVEYQHFLYSTSNTNRIFTQHTCVSKMCNSCLYIPNTVQPGQCLALLNRAQHNHSAPANNYDELGRSIQLNSLFKAIEILQIWDYDINRAFKNGIEKVWISQQTDSDVIEAINTFMEACLLCEGFEEQFSGDGSCSLYMRLKCGITDESSFEECFNSQAYVGWRSGTKANRLKIERKGDYKQKWMKTIKFCAQNSPPNIVETGLLIPTVDLLRNVSEQQAKASEALLQELFVKPTGREKLIMNETYDKCPKECRLNSVEDDHKAAAFIILRGTWQANNFRFDDYRPYKTGNAQTVNQTELGKRLREINRDDSIKDLDDALEKLDALREFLRDEGYEFDVSTGAPISKKPRI